MEYMQNGPVAAHLRRKWAVNRTILAKGRPESLVGVQFSSSENTASYADPNLPNEKY